MATRTSYPSNDIVRIPSRDLLVDNIPVLHGCYSAEIASKGFHSTSIMTSTICRPCLATCHRPCPDVWWRKFLVNPWGTAYASLNYDQWDLEIN